MGRDSCRDRPRDRVHAASSYRSRRPGKLALRFILDAGPTCGKRAGIPGDVRCHFLTPHGALLEAAAEDMAVVNLLAVECHRPFGRTSPPCPISSPSAVSTRPWNHPATGRRQYTKHASGIRQSRPPELPPHRLPASLRRGRRRGRLDAGGLVRSMPPQRRPGHLDANRRTNSTAFTTANL